MVNSKCLFGFLFVVLFSANENAIAQQYGLITRLPASCDSGYVLFSPVNADTTYLIDRNGRFVHKWACGKSPGLTAYLLPDGTLLRTGKYANPSFVRYGSLGGIIERYDWNGNKVWSLVISDSAQTQNQDVCVLPDGNIIVVVWEKITKDSAIARGRNPSLLDNELWSAKLIEIHPVGTDSAAIKWQWRAWDHLIQDADPSKPGYGVVAAHPELLNVNYTNTFGLILTDWLHIDAVTYNPALDQIMICSKNISEIYIIDHSTTTSQAAGHSGGIRHKGGDFLYRWGNPAAYNRGARSDQVLFCPHNPTWINSAYRFGKDIMIFNNGSSRPDGLYTSIDIIKPPVDADGNYTIDDGKPYGPASLTWSYKDTVPERFFTNAMGSAQMLRNGHVLICNAKKGTFFEIDSSKKVVWRYVNPVGEVAPAGQGNMAKHNECHQGTFYPASYPGLKGKFSQPVKLNSPKAPIKNKAKNAKSLPSGAR